MTTNQKRIEQATTYWLEQGETIQSARKLALEQVDWEDEQAIQWQGPNDGESVWI